MPRRETESLLKRGRAALVSPERMFVWDFDHHDTNTVRVRDQKLHEYPCLSPRFAENRHAEVHKTSIARRILSRYGMELGRSKK